MSICSSDIVTLSTTYDCVKICGQVASAPVADYEIDIDNFLIDAIVITSTGNVMYKWIIKTNEYEIYNSGYGNQSDPLPLIGNGSVFEQFQFGVNYIDLKNMLNNIAPYYQNMELYFELIIKDESGKESESVNIFVLNY